MNGFALRHRLGGASGVCPSWVWGGGVGLLLAGGGFIGVAVWLQSFRSGCGPGCLIATVAVVVAGMLAGGLAVGLRREKVAKPARADESGPELPYEGEQLKMALDKHAMVSVTDAEGRILYVNDRFCAISKYAREELIGQDHRLVNSGYHSKDFMRDLWETILSGRVWKGEMKNRARDGSFYWAEATIVPVLGRNHKPMQYISIHVDTTGRVQSELAASRLLDRVQRATQGSGIGVWDWDLKDDALIWDDYTCALYGLRTESMAGGFEAWVKRVHPEDRERFRAGVQSALAAEHLLDDSFRVLWPDDVVRYLRVRAVVQRDEAGRPVRMTGTNWDITDQKLAEGRLDASLREKEVLLKEIHHRVKNNLQVVSSLLSLQSMRIADPRALGAFRTCQHQVRSMALLHEKLYQSEDCSRIDFGAYLKSLVEHLFNAFGSSAAHVAYTIDAPNISLSLDAAIPCGLIVNELGSNALKYAFAERAHGKIQVEMRQEPEGRYSLWFRDDGVGLPKDLDWRKAASLGLQLVNLLTRQLHGTIDYRNGLGTEFHIVFQDPAVAHSLTS
jgi:PAS domain S-box-containing protein